MNIRRYQDCDAKAVKVLHKVAMQHVGAYLPGPWDTDMDSISETYLNEPGEFLVGLVNNEIVAMGALRPISITIGEIKRIRVHPNYQRQGFGQKILEQLESAARSLGYNQLELDTLEDQISAVQFFQKNGYQLKGTRQFKGHEQLLLTKKLGSAI